MLIYLHGFNSSPASKKATVLGAYLAARGLRDQFLCPALAHRPAEAVAQVEALIATCPSAQITFIGSSLGGYYATYLAERHDARAVLINPAVHPGRDLVRYLGPQRNLYTGEAYELTTAHMEQIQQLWIDTLTPSRYFLLVETFDEVLDYREAIARYAGCRQIVVEGGDHTLQSFPQHIPDIIAFASVCPRL